MKKHEVKHSKAEKWSGLWGRMMKGRRVRTEIRKALTECIIMSTLAYVSVTLTWKEGLGMKAVE